MDRGLYVAMTGAKQIMQAQAVNNHNIANASTTGFRADGVAFTSEPVYGPGYASRVNAVAGDAGTDFSSGVMMNTSRPLDIAVNGKGFIAVQGADGKEAYTRAGDLQVTASGTVITATGFQVLSESGPLTVPPSNKVTIGADGTVSVVPLGLSAAAQSQVDRIKLVNPATKDLQKGPDGRNRHRRIRRIGVEQCQCRAVAGQYDRTTAFVRVADQEHQFDRSKRTERAAHDDCGVRLKGQRRKESQDESRIVGRKNRSRRSKHPDVGNCE
jgi:flagellar basal-body rod protein FlgF